MAPSSNDPLVPLLRGVFRSRTDRIVLATPRDLRRAHLEPRSASVADEEQLERAIAHHLAGEKRVGFFNRRAPSGASWGVIEIDPGPGGDARAATDDSIALLERIREEELAAHRESGRFGPGHFQIWLFVDGSVHGHEMRALLEALIERCALATPARAIPDGDGNASLESFAWLPLFGGEDLWLHGESSVREGLGTPRGATLFLDSIGEPFADQQRVLLELRRNSPEAIRAALRRMGVTARADDPEALATHHAPIPCNPDAFYHLLGNCHRLQRLYERQRDTGLDPDERYLVLRLLTCLGDFGEREALAFARLGGASEDEHIETIVAELRQRYEAGLASPPSCADLGSPGCFENVPPLRFEDGRWHTLRGADRESAPPPTPLWLLERHARQVATSAPARPRPSIEPDPEELLIGPTDTSDLANLLSPPIALTDPEAPGLGPALDQALGGGLRRGEMTLLTGVPGSAKTALCLQLASTLAHRASRERVHGSAWGTVVYVSPVETRRALSLRLLSRISGIPLRALGSSALVQNERIRSAASALDRISSYLDLVDLARQSRDYFTAGDLVSVLDEARERVDAAAVVLVVDAIPSLRTGRDATDADPAHRVDAVAEELLALAQREDVAVVAVHEDDGQSRAPLRVARDALRLELGGPAVEGLESDLSALVGSVTAGERDDATPAGRRATLEALRLSRGPLDPISLILDPTTGRFTET